MAKVSPTLYGLMTEEINYSLRWRPLRRAANCKDRTFLSTRSDTENWIPVPQGTAHGSVARDPSTGPEASALTASLEDDCGRADAANAYGLRNRGWWGIPLRANTVYSGSIYAKGDKDAAAGHLRVSLIANDTGKVLASYAHPPLTADWKQYDFTLKTGADDAAHRCQPDPGQLRPSPAMCGCSCSPSFRRRIAAAPAAATAWT